MGAFMAAVNLRQMGSGGFGDVASQLERPVWHVHPSHLTGEVIEKAVGNIVPGGDLAVRGGRRKSDWIVSEWHGDRTTFCHPCTTTWLSAAAPAACAGRAFSSSPTVSAAIRGATCCTKTSRSSGPRRPPGCAARAATPIPAKRVRSARWAWASTSPTRCCSRASPGMPASWCPSLPASGAIPTAANVVVSMSLNPQAVADCWENVWPDGERVTRPIDERVRALVSAQAMGFVVRLRLDPILPIPGWQDLYRQFLAQAAAAGLRPGRVTLGLFRQQTGQLAAWARRWGLPPLGWQPPAMVRDGTHEQLPAEQRVAIYREVAAAVRVAWPDAEISLCKETRAVRSAVGVTASRCNRLATSRPSGQSHPSPGAAFPKS